MTPSQIRKMGGKTRWRIVETLKSGGGACIQDLAGQLGMSYMGVKEACLALQKSGFLESRRIPSSGGRPRLEYRLTARAEQLFPGDPHGIVLELLEAATALFGNSAAEKLLLLLFKRTSERYARRLTRGTPQERARRLAEIRSAEGHMSRWEPAGELSEPSVALPLGGGMLWGRLTEAHSPILEVLRAYPIAARLEAEMLAGLIGGRVVRVDELDSGGYRCFFWVQGT